MELTLFLFFFSFSALTAAAGLKWHNFVFVVISSSLFFVLFASALGGLEQYSGESVNSTVLSTFNETQVEASSSFCDYDNSTGTTNTTRNVPVVNETATLKIVSYAPVTGLLFNSIGMFGLSPLALLCLVLGVALMWTAVILSQKVGDEQ